MLLLFDCFLKATALSLMLNPPVDIN